MEESSPEQFSWASGDVTHPDAPCGHRPAAEMEGIYYRALKIMLGIVFVGQPMHSWRFKRREKPYLVFKE